MTETTGSALWARFNTDSMTCWVVCHATRIPSVTLSRPGCLNCWPTEAWVLGMACDFVDTRRYRYLAGGAILKL